MGETDHHSRWECEEDTLAGSGDDAMNGVILFRRASTLAFAGTAQWLE